MSCSLDSANENFNPTLVQLELSGITGIAVLHFLFQSHIGAIRICVQRAACSMQRAFQSHIGAIRINTTLPDANTA